jgi:sulfate adenylyltransferase
MRLPKENFATMIQPHGGLSQPVNRLVEESRRADWVRSAAELPKLPVSDADLSSLYRFADGGLSPLEGPMTKEAFDRVLSEEVIVHNGKRYAWTIPISFPASYEVADSLKVGQKAALVNGAGELVGTIDVEDVFPFEKGKYLRSVYLTDRLDHPGARMVLEDNRHRLVGGKVEVLPQPKNPSYGQLVLSPTETRAYFAEKGWERVVAFQTRNPLHRAHEYALIYGLESLVRDGYNAGAVLNPLVGETKSDDVDAVTRMKTYMALIDGGAFGEGDVDEALWSGKPFTFRERVALLALDIKMFYAGPKEAIMHAIYRQNFGFTDIIIGRKHADAPYDDGKDIWDGLEAQRKFDSLAGELLIKPVKVGFAAFFEELGRVGLVDTYAPKGYHPVSISGRDLRKTLQSGQLPDPRIMRRETAEVLIAAMASK